ncbi:MAG: hypothetical protein ACLP8S_19205 [Solirubrobacteraceae bacterium]
MRLQGLHHIMMITEMHAHLRAHLPRALTPLQSPRVAQRERVAG